ncbi:MAG: helix-turn-helix domain-containing protein [Oscillospiraceae bacterium]|nr:helix-turn-helix domain-containing protein [Oscillospiraceae bacterium]
MTFGEKIQKLRKEAGLSQEELSYQLKVSRQAVSKWECDNGYPETEKIVRMSRLFNVSLDYLLNDDDLQKPEISPDEKGIYISREMAEGFLSYQKRKLQKTGIAIGLFVGGLSISFWDAEISMVLLMICIIVGIVLLFSVKLADDPYRKIWTENLSFDKTVKSELISDYSDKKKSVHIINLVGITMIAAGFFVCQLIVPAEMYVVDNIVFACGMILAGVGAFLCVYMSGIVRAYRILIMNEEYHEKRK